MERLTKGMFGADYENKSGAFGLCNRQMRDDDIVHNGSWYNRRGEKLGWGDLDANDLRRIANELPEDEAFVILGESDSFWSFVTHYGPGGGLCRTKAEADAPGTEYVAGKCFMVVVRGRVISLTRDDARHGTEGTLQFGLAALFLNRETIRDLVVGAVA